MLNRTQERDLAAIVLYTDDLKRIQYIQEDCSKLTNQLIQADTLLKLIQNRIYELQKTLKG